MDSPLKQRLIGAAVLAALAIIFLPMLLKGPDVKEPDAAQVPLSMPNAPDQAFSTHELPLTVPDAHTPSGGVLGMETRPVPRPDALPASGSTSFAPAPLDSEIAPTTDAPDTTPNPTPGAATPAAGPTTPPAIAANPAAVSPSAVKLPPSASAPVSQAPATPVVAPDAAPSPVKPSAVAAGNYSVNVGSFSNLGNAGALVTRLRGAGLPVTTEKVKLNGADALRIRVGPYADRAAAEAARLRAEAMAGGSGKVIALDGDDKSAASVKAPAASKPVAATALPAPISVPAPSSAAVSGKPAASVSSGFAVQLAAPAEESAALALRDRARAAGFTAFVQRVDSVNGPRFRVRAGPVADHNAAETLRDSVKQKLDIDGNIVAHP